MGRGRGLGCCTWGRRPCWRTTRAVQGWAKGAYCTQGAAVGLFEDLGREGGRRLILPTSSVTCANSARVYPPHFLCPFHWAPLPVLRPSLTQTR